MIQRFGITSRSREIRVMRGDKVLGLFFTRVNFFRIRSTGQSGKVSKTVNSSMAQRTPRPTSDRGEENIGMAMEGAIRPNDTCMGFADEASCLAFGYSLLTGSCPYLLALLSLASRSELKLRFTRP